jgi:hypothetical protein
VRGYNTVRHVVVGHPVRRSPVLSTRRAAPHVSEGTGGRLLTRAARKERFVSRSSALPSRDREGVTMGLQPSKGDKDAEL